MRKLKLVIDFYYFLEAQSSPKMIRGFFQVLNRILCDFSSLTQIKIQHLCVKTSRISTTFELQNLSDVELNEFCPHVSRG